MDAACLVYVAAIPLGGQGKPDLELLTALANTP